MRSKNERMLRLMRPLAVVVVLVAVAAVWVAEWVALAVEMILVE
jgi:hypothetical protein